MNNPQKRRMEKSSDVLLALEARKRETGAVKSDYLPLTNALKRLRARRLSSLG